MQKNEKKHQSIDREDEDLDQVIRSAVECYGTLGDRLRGSSTRFRV